MVAKDKLLHGLQVLVLLAAAALVVIASVDVFTTHSFTSSPWAIQLQSLICAVMAIELCVEYFISDHRTRYVLTHWPFLLLCIPYSLALGSLGIEFAEPWALIMQIIPLLRAVFVFGELLSALRFSNVGSITGAYVALLAAILYFSSLIFYIAEYGINPEVHTFRSAFYWAVMSMTTTGSNIPEMTVIGQALAAILPASGLILFPVFTVYIASSIARASKGAQS